MNTKSEEIEKIEYECKRNARLIIGHLSTVLLLDRVLWVGALSRAISIITAVQGVKEEDMDSLLQIIKTEHKKITESV